MKRHYTRILFVISIITLLLVSLVTFRNLSNYMEEVRLIRHSNRIIRTTQLVLSTIKDAEIGHRGFQLTRDTLYLKPYYSALSVLPGQLKLLDSLVTDNETQRKNVNSLNALIQNQFLIISNILSNASRSTLYMDTYESNLLSRSRENMDALRKRVNDVLEEEQRIVLIRGEKESDYKTTAPVALLSYTILSLFGVLFLFSKVMDELRKREKAETMVLENFKQLQQQKSIIEERKIILNEAESLSQMGSWKWTESTDDLVWSEGLYRIFDKKMEEPISWNSFLENVFPDDITLVENCLHDVKTNKNGSSIDYRIVKDDEIRYLSLTVKPHSVFSIDILGAVIDITRRKEQEKQLAFQNIEKEKRAEELIIANKELAFQNEEKEKRATELSIANKELDEKEKRYRTLFERSIDPIFLATGSLVLIDVNDSFTSFLGYSEIEALPIASLFANPDDHEYFKGTLKEMGQIRDFETMLITKSGEQKACLLNCVFIPDQAFGFSCYQGIVHDLTHLKKAENDMLMAERLALTGKIARTIAHEVRNPLTNLNLALDQLREEMPANNESAKLYGDIIERNANRIEQLVEEMLNSSKPKQLDLKLTSIKEILDDTISLAIDRIKLKQIELITSYQGDFPRILVDKNKIQIALLNIIINAVEAMVPGKGVLRIDVSVRENMLTLSIADNGKGIPAGEIGKLFDPFFTSKQSGMGLGLTSTKNILNSHNAQVEVKSELNKGTTFHIHFKLAE